MRRAAGVLALVFGAAIATRAGEALAWACPSESRVLATAFGRAPLVFFARVLRSTRVTGRDERQTTVEILQVLRGSSLRPGTTVTVFTCRGGKCGGSLTRGGEYVIDGWFDRRGRIVEHGACGFTASLAGPRGAALRAELEALAAATGSTP